MEEIHVRWWGAISATTFILAVLPAGARRSSSVWVPSTSRSMALPTSRRNPARRGVPGVRGPSSWAMAALRKATSLECWRTFWPWEVRNFSFPHQLDELGMEVLDAQFHGRRFSVLPDLVLELGTAVSATSSIRAGWMRPSRTSRWMASQAASRRTDRSWKG